MTPKPNALSALAEVGKTVAEYGAFILFISAIAAWWWITP